jgi:hypothetical protein
MDVQTREEHQWHARALTNSDQQALRPLRGSPLLEDCVEIIDALLTTGRKLEQEAVGAERVVQQLRQAERNTGNGSEDRPQSHPQ